MIILAILTTNISNIDLPPHSVTVRQLKGILSIVDRTFKLKSHIYIYISKFCCIAMTVLNCINQ